jgi:anti-sigma regulatory factor (Ser/Thr protein kinase)
MDAHAPVAGRLRAAWQARQLICHVLGEHHPAVDDALLIASELVTNAVVHTRSGEPDGSLTVSVGTSLHPPAVGISVRD